MKYFLILALLLTTPASALNLSSERQSTNVSEAPVNVVELRPLSSLMDYVTQNNSELDRLKPEVVKDITAKLNALPQRVSMHVPDTAQVYVAKFYDGSIIVIQATDKDELIMATKIILTSAQEKKVSEVLLRDIFDNLEVIITPGREI